MSTWRTPQIVASLWQTLSQCCIEYKVNKSVAKYRRCLILRGTIIAVFYNEVYVKIWTPGSSFVQSLPPFRAYSTYSIQHCYCCCSKWFLKADLNIRWNPYCVNTWTFIWHNSVSNQLLGQRFVGYFVWPSLADDVGPTPCFSSGQRPAQQLAQPDILSANMLSTI